MASLTDDVPEKLRGISPAKGNRSSGCSTLFSNTTGEVLQGLTGYRDERM